MKAMQFLYIPSLFLSVLLSVFWNSLAQTDITQTNLLFIMFDDLRPELSNYGRTHMITPNFERLASKSVTFDYAFTHIAVCNPARDAIMTGLRPDAVGTYNFGHSFRPHLTFPSQLIKSGYNTAGFGKVFHWEGADKSIWSYDQWDNNWYDYQNREWKWQNSSTMPDKYKKEEDFRDFEFTTRAINTLKKMSQHESKYWMLAIGYKLPHLTVHIPYKYYDMYKGKSAAWKLTKKELRFPITTSEVSYRCCAEGEFKFMNEEGSLRYNRSVPIGNINNAFTDEMHDELMLGYNAAVTFVDVQLGRILDVLDELNLWNNVTVILSADHGMHNGEKGIWEKWTLFEEAVRVPLMIAHPKSPFKGQHYRNPVESVDIYATVNEILKVPVSREHVCENNKGSRCKPLQGKSLAPIVLGKGVWENNFGNTESAKKTDTDGKVLRTFHIPEQKSTENTDNVQPNSEIMPVMNQIVAISQANRCANKQSIPAVAAHKLHNHTLVHSTDKMDEVGPAAHKTERHHIWGDCDMRKKSKTDLYLMGYSMRTPEYRYTAYFLMDMKTEKPQLDVFPYEEELYDHKNEQLSDFTHRETVNLAYRPLYATVLSNLREKLIKFIQEHMTFGDHGDGR